MSWWQDVITQAFNPPVEPGEDIGTPFHTSINALAGGTVVSETRGGFGERVDIAMPGGVNEYYQHLDTINPNLKVGSQVTPGEFLGLSGGQLQGGSNPNSPQNSTGPHIEVGLYSSATGAPINPAAFVSSGLEPDAQESVGIGGGPSTGTPQAQAQAASQMSGSPLVNVNFPNPFAGLSGWISSTWSNATGAAAVYIIPLVIAGLIILVVLGSGNSSSGGGQQSSSPAPQIIPVPV